MKCRYLHPAASGYLYTSIDRTGNCLNLILLQLTDGYCFLIYIVSMRIIADQVAYCMNINLFKKLLRLLSDSFLNLRCLSFLSYPSYFSYLITTISHCKITSGSCMQRTEPIHLKHCHSRYINSVLYISVPIIKLNRFCSFIILHLAYSTART